MSNKPKTINGLMKYLRDTKGLNISGSSQKQKLMNIGYYHGYKGYRYIDKPANRAPFTQFEELIAVYDFDMQLKALFYPYVMQIETALKTTCWRLLLRAYNRTAFLMSILNCWIIISAIQQLGQNIVRFKIENEPRINSKKSFKGALT